MLGLWWFLGFAGYAYVAFTLQTIAGKTNTPNKWFAWIPILNIYLMCKIAGKPGWWLILFLIPFVNIVINVIVWMNIAKARNKPRWLGILMLIPLVNFIFLTYIAFSE